MHTGKIKIIGNSPLDQKQVSLLEQRDVIFVEKKPGSTTEKETIKLIGDASVVVLGASTPITSKVLDQCHRLRKIISSATGIDHIDINLKP